jgi:hypothetical protein
MAFDILVPEPNNKPKNSKDAVINILTTEWPLTLKEIFYRIKREFGYSSTYQSVYKAVKELIEKGVLKKKEKKYEINIDWIKKVQSFTDIVETNYYAKKRLHALAGLKESKTHEDLMILSFENIFDAEKYLYYFMKNELFRKRDDTICWRLSHEWRPLFYLRAEYNYYRRLMEKGHKFYFSCSGGSYLEEISKKFYRSIGIRYKTIKQDTVNDTLVFGDYFIQIFIPEELRNKMKECLVKKDIMGILKNVLEKKSKTPIRLVINKDAVLADEIRKQFRK